MKVLLLGSSGYLGKAFLRSKAPAGVTLIPVDRTQVDYFNDTAHVKRTKIFVSALTFFGKSS